MTSIDFFRLLLFTTIISSTAIRSHAQIQKGNDIDGEAANDASGFSISMVDTNTVAIGAPNNAGNGLSAGHVRVFHWKNSTWVQKGLDIDGEQTKDKFGQSISMADPNTLAIGAPSFRGGNKLGYVKVYRWNGASWVQKGGKINGDVSNTLTGWAVSMGDSNTLAISAIYKDGQGFYDNGRVQIYTWNGTRWAQKGGDLWGESSGDESGYSISMPDKNTIAIGAPNNGNGKGHVRVYSWNNSSWIQKGEDIEGVLSNDFLGASISMPYPDIIAIGARDNNLTRVFRWNGIEWVQVGTDINGGYIVSMPDTTTLSIGYPADSGKVSIFTWSGNTWKKKGADIIGEVAGDRSGYQVSMPTENAIAVSAPDNDGAALNAGHVRIYSLYPCKTSYSSFSETACLSYTAPSGRFIFNSSGIYQDTIPNSTGCDSVITINLTVKTVEVSITQIGSTITATAPGAIYQWLDCNNNFTKINGANDQKFLVNTNGNYAVEVQQNGCTDTSECLNINSISILENALDNTLKAYPNPTQGDIIIELEAQYEELTVKIKNIFGQEVLRKSYSNANSLQLCIPGEAGFYFIELTAKDKKRLFMVIKK